MQDLDSVLPSATERRRLVQRILASNIFRRSHRLSAFLRYIVEQQANGDLSAINEARIGTEVFGRAPGYHAGDDSIVRSQARFLRQRLEEYFATEGLNEALVLRIPKGSYVPHFELRSVAAAAAPPVPPPEPLPAPAPGSLPAQSDVRFAKHPWRRHVLPGALAAALVATLLLAVSLSRDRLHRPLQGQPSVVQAFWTSLFNPTRATLIVPADSTLVLMEEITGKPVHLSAYIDRSYLTLRPADSVPLWDMLAGSEYTSTADLNLVAHLQRVTQAIDAAPTIRYARDLSLKDLKERNAILIGGLRANPWMELFASNTNFDVDYDVQKHLNVVRNRAPGPGEQPLYLEKPYGTGGARAYGVVVYLPSLDNQGHALLVEGTSKAGTEAAAEFLTSPAFAQFLSKIAPQPASGNVPNFEVLLSTDILDGASYHPVIVCWHVLRKSPNG